jgi:thymidylate synthase
MSRSKHPEKQYLDLLQDILDNGQWKISHSTGVKLKSVFGRQIRFDLSKGFPLLTTKKTFWRGIVHELIWFLSGSSSIKYLIDNDVHIWDDWAYKPYKELMDKGKIKNLSLKKFIAKAKANKSFMKKWSDIGPVYGVQWRHWPAEGGRKIDQLKWAIDKIKEKPQKKHYVISAWNAGSIYEMAPTRAKSMVIAPCHTMFHINITGDRLSLLLYQRSSDMFLGVPFNIASYALLTLILAHITGYKPGHFVHTFGDAHIYENHFNQVKEQLKRTPRKLPTVKINPKVESIDKLKFDDFKLSNYDPYPPIRAKITIVGGF